MFGYDFNRGFDPSKAVNVKFCAEIRERWSIRLEQTLEQIISEGAKDVRILLSSDGGNVETGIELHNTLKSLLIDLTTHNIGAVDSITNLVFLAAKKRFSTPNARFLMHGVSRAFKTRGDSSLSLNEQDLKNALKAVERDHQRIAETIARHSKMTESQLMRLFRRGDTIYMPDQAMKLGLIHDIKEVEPVEIDNLILINGQENG